MAARSIAATARTVLPCHQPARINFSVCRIEVMKFSPTSLMRNAERGMRNSGQRSAPVPGAAAGPILARPDVQAVLLGNGGDRASARRHLQSTMGRARAGFTMIEIALCLAIIGFALISILLVLPSGMNTQRDTRQETIIGQDASMLLEAIRSGARGMDDLTNYVYEIVNSWTEYRPDGSINRIGVNTNSYVWASVNIPPTSLGSDILPMHLTNGLRIIGLLSTPEYTDAAGEPIPCLNFGGVSNHVVAYVRSFSGLAAEKPPQNNQIMQEDTFRYRLLCVNAPISADTNIFYLAPLWQNQSYPNGTQVFYRWIYWQASATTGPGDIPGQSRLWVKVPVYALEMLHAQHELRLLFLWPQLPSGNVGGFRQTFRASIAGQLTRTNYGNYFPSIGDLYFYASQSFRNAP
jgi:type II secretory pathway pseudopilin PulG